jgi:two-component system response regulator AtoC
VESDLLQGLDINMNISASRVVEPLGNASFVPGHSPTIQSVNAMVGEIAHTNIPVLLVGESGTGKEVYARLIHSLSRHCDTPLKKLSCRALEPRELLAQLKRCLKGNAEGSQGDSRTVFLDGIDELDPQCQKVLLSQLPDGEMDSRGNGSLRLVASASRNLDKEIETGGLRRELYFRIAGVYLRLPALRERKEDIPGLMVHFLAKYATELGRDVAVLNEEEMQFLGKYEWPGNIRELENLARKIALFGTTWKVMDEFRVMSSEETGPAEDAWGFSLKVTARAASLHAERELIQKALERTHWNRKRAAQDLQISYKALLYKIKQTGLEGQKAERG